MNDTINIAIAVDNNLKYYASTMLISLFENNRESDFHFYIVTDNKHLKEIEYLFKIIRQYKSKYTIITLNDEHLKLLSSMLVSLHVTYFAYVRLLLPEILPDTIDKVLYLDIDLLIVDKIKPLWKTDISNYSLAAIVQYIDKAVEHPITIERFSSARQILGVPQDSPYFNSGVLLMNLNYFRESGIINKMIQFILDYPNFITFWDQDVLNLFLYDNFLELDKCWNMDGPNTVKYPHIKPAILHYSGIHKPLSGHSVHPNREEFIKYFKKNYLYKYYIADKLKNKLKALLKIDRSNGKK